MMRVTREGAVRSRGFGAILAGILMALAIPCRAQEASKPSQAKSDSISIAAVGDIIAPEPFLDRKEEAFSSVMEVIQHADAGFGNLEEILIDFHHFKGYPEAQNGGAWLVGVPQVATDLRSANIRLVARANNHSTEWSIEGMHETSRILEEAGVVYAGVGDDRAAARAAAYLPTPHGKIGLVSMTSTFTGSSPAAPALRMAPARPGANVIRTKETHFVDQEMMNALVRIRDAQKGGVARGTPGQTATELELFDVSYRVDKARVGSSTFAMNPVDVAENVESIRKASAASNATIATIHTHEPGNWSEQPPDFLVELAHKAIDAGAAEFVGHGPHQLRSIEIYKGKPIFYSLGDFIFQVEKLTPVPFEMYEALGQDPAKMSDRELGDYFVGKILTDPILYQGAIAVTRFRDGKSFLVELYPVELGFATKDGNRGLPRRPTAEMAQTILQRLQRISAPFHTEIRIENGVGIIRISQN